VIRNAPIVSGGWLVKYFYAERDALVADMGARPSNEVAHVVLLVAEKRTPHLAARLWKQLRASQLSALTLRWHRHT
jgi:hypothetical protein